MRVLEYIGKNLKIPEEFNDSVIFHCGPIVKNDNGDWIVVSAGPTTSFRMESMEHELIRRFGVRMLIGKGGMGSKTAKALKECCAVYCSFPGGAGAFVAQKINKIVKVEWLDLGSPEAVWLFEVNDFGPLIVTMDSYGDNIYEKVNNEVMQNYENFSKAE